LLLGTTFPKILMSSGSIKGTQICYPFPSKSPGKRIPSRFPNGALMERHTRLQGIFTSQYISFYLSLRLPSKGAPSMFPNRVPMGRDTPSPEPLVYFQSFIHSCMSAGVSRKGALLHTHGEKHTVTVHGAPCRRKAYIQWDAAWFPKGIVTTLLSLPQCHAAFGMVPSTLAWVDQSPVSQHVSWQPPSGYTLHNCYCLPCDQG